MASIEEAIFNLFNTAYAADSADGGMTDHTLTAGGDNPAYVAEFWDFDDPQRAVATPSIRVEVPTSAAIHSFGQKAYRVTVRLHIYTQRDRGEADQRAISDRCIIVFHDIAPSTQNGWTVSRITHRGGHRLESNEEVSHRVERFNAYMARTA